MGRAMRNGWRFASEHNEDSGGRLLRVPDRRRGRQRPDRLRGEASAVAPSGRRSLRPATTSSNPRDADAFSDASCLARHSNRNRHWPHRRPRVSASAVRCSRSSRRHRRPTPREPRSFLPATSRPVTTTPHTRAHDRDPRTRGEGCAGSGASYGRLAGRLISTDTVRLERPCRE